MAKHFSQRALDRMQNEIGAYDAEAMEAFKSAHGGLEPIQLVVSLMPLRDQLDWARDRPHQCRPEVVRLRREIDRLTAAKATPENRS